MDTSGGSASKNRDRSLELLALVREELLADERDGETEDVSEESLAELERWVGARLLDPRFGDDPPIRDLAETLLTGDGEFDAAYQTISTQLRTELVAVVDRERAARAAQEPELLQQLLKGHRERMVMSLGDLAEKVSSIGRKLAQTEAGADQEFQVSSESLSDMETGRADLLHERSPVQIAAWLAALDAQDAASELLERSLRTQATHMSLAAGPVGSHPDEQVAAFIAAVNRLVKDPPS